MNSKTIWRTTYVTERSTSDIEGVGNTRVVADNAGNSNMYRWVKNADSVALTLGQAAFHKLADGTDMLKNVYQALTANLSVLGGIVVATDGLDATTGSLYGWIQIYGMNSSVSISGATTGGTDIAIGDYLKGVNAASHLVRDTSSNTAAFFRYVRAMEAITTTTTPAATYKKGFIVAI